MYRPGVGLIGEQAHLQTATNEEPEVPEASVPASAPASAVEKVASVSCDEPQRAEVSTVLQTEAEITLAKMRVQTLERVRRHRAKKKAKEDERP